MSQRVYNIFLYMVIFVMMAIVGGSLLSMTVSEYEEWKAFITRDAIECPIEELEKL